MFQSGLCTVLQQWVHVPLGFMHSFDAGRYSWSLAPWFARPHLHVFEGSSVGCDVEGSDCVELLCFLSVAGVALLRAFIIVLIPASCCFSSLICCFMCSVCSIRRLSAFDGCLRSCW